MEEEFVVNHGKSVCSVGLGNLDLGHITNGFPGDPIEKRPFDFSFRRQTVLGWWRKVGFLPMTRNSVNDPKVSKELGVGGGPEEESRRMEWLVQDYAEGAQRLTDMGYNGFVFDVEMPRVKECVLPEGTEERIQALMDSGNINRAGTLYKCGNTVINSHELLEAHRRMEVKKVTDKEENEKENAVSEKTKAMSDIESALYHWEEWREKGKPVTRQNKPKLSKAAAVAIVKILLPRIDPNEDLAGYKNMGTCVDWLVNLARGTDWETELGAVRSEYCKACKEAQPRLF